MEKTNRAPRRKKRGSNKLEGVKRYRKGRTLCDTIFGRTRFGKDILTNKWVIIKESKRKLVEARKSLRGFHVKEDLGNEIQIHQHLMACPDLSPHIVKLIDTCDDVNYIYVITEFLAGGDLLNFVHNTHPLYKGTNVNAETDEMDIAQSPSAMSMDGEEVAYDSLSPEQQLELDKVVKGILEKLEENVTAAEEDVNWDHVAVGVAQHFSVDLQTAHSLIRGWQTKPTSPNSLNEEWFSMVQHLFRQLVAGVQWMHSKRCCHLDLSLENVLLNEAGVVKIIDFGVCRLYRPDNTEFRTPKGFVGKIGYCAPEVYYGKEFDGRKADIWSLGVILFVLLVGSPPYKQPCNSDNATRLLLEGGLAKLLEAWNRPIPPQAQDLLQRIFQLEPDRMTMEAVVAHPWVALQARQTQQPKRQDPTS